MENCCFFCGKIHITSLLPSFLQFVLNFYIISSFNWVFFIFTFRGSTFFACICYIINLHSCHHSTTFWLPNINILKNYLKIFVYIHAQPKQHESRLYLVLCSTNLSLAQVANGQYISIYNKIFWYATTASSKPRLRFIIETFREKNAWWPLFGITYKVIITTYNAKALEYAY